MRKIIYCCDECGKQLSVDNKGKAHLSVDFGSHSGWVAPETNWQHIEPVRGIHQFCNGQCLARFFNKIKKQK